jgi:hypothetical protein
VEQNRWKSTALVLQRVSFATRHGRAILSRDLLEAVAQIRAKYQSDPEKQNRSGNKQVGQFD